MKNLKSLSFCLIVFVLFIGEASAGQITTKVVPKELPKNAAKVQKEVTKIAPQPQNAQQQSAQGQGSWLVKILPTKVIVKIPLKNVVLPEGYVTRLVYSIVSLIGCWESDAVSALPIIGQTQKETKGNTYYLLRNRNSAKLEYKKSTDHCKDDKFLYEYDCNKYQTYLSNHANDPSRYPTSENDLVTLIRCGDDEICRDGACIPDPCLDTDQGELNFTTAGTVVLNTANGRTELPDTCVSESVLSEGGCNGLDAYIEHRVNCCDFGMICHGGRCDFPAAGQENRCHELADLCPDIEGIQGEYLFDQNGDGEKDSCVPVRENVCSEPNPGQVYPNATVYEHEGNLHLGFCIEGEPSSILHVICQDNGEYITDITECAGGMPCVNGECGVCFDNDNGLNWDVIGTAAVYQNGGFRTYQDGCDGVEIIEYYCENDAAQSERRRCPEGQRCHMQFIEGAVTYGCAPQEEPSCTDTDNGINFDRQGEVRGIRPDGWRYNDRDGCRRTARIEYYCEGNIERSVIEACPEGQTCVVEIVDGVVVVRCVPPVAEATCADTDNGIDFEHFGSVGGIRLDGSRYLIEDTCANNSIAEQYCDGGTPMTSERPCPQNQRCRRYNNDNGQTILACTANCIKVGDPNNNVNVAGVVYDLNNQSYPDFCEGRTLRQFSCDQATGAKVDIPAFECPNGCDAGACLR